MTTQNISAGDRVRFRRRFDGPRGHVFEGTVRSVRENGLFEVSYVTRQARGGSAVANTTFVRPRDVVEVVR